MATIKDVAKLAGVSVATVSRVINNSPKASETSRMAVCNAMEQLQYHPNANARALVFPSYVEGFGLPLVEAMQRGLPAMASDIPVFREIGGEFMAYFNLDDPQTLADRVTQFESSDEFPASRSVADWQWIGWREASQQLVNGTLEGLRQGQSLSQADATRS